MFCDTGSPKTTFSGTSSNCRAVRGGPPRTPPPPPPPPKKNLRNRRRGGGGLGGGVILYPLVSIRHAEQCRRIYIYIYIYIIHMYIYIYYTYVYIYMYSVLASAGWSPPCATGWMSPCEGQKNPSSAEGPSFHPGRQEETWLWFLCWSPSSAPAPLVWLGGFPY